MFNIHLLPGSFGDAILIEYGKRKPRYILIDGGPYFGFRNVMEGLRKVAPKLTTLELLVVTHVDIDHIDGILVLLNQPELPIKIKEIWYNGYEQLQAPEQDDLLGVLQGEMLSVLIKRNKLKHNRVVKGGPLVVRNPEVLPQFKLTGGMIITLLAPTAEGIERMRAVWEKEIAIIGNEEAVAKRLDGDHRYDEDLDDLLGDASIEDMQKAISPPDRSQANGSSVAFLATYEGKTALMAGDSPSRELLPALEYLRGSQDRLWLDAWKLAHHGSRKSTQPVMMAMIDCPRLLFSSNGKRYKHPDQECIAKLIGHKTGRATFYFNYRSDFNKMWEDPARQLKYDYETFYPEEGEEGMTIRL